MMLSEFQTVGRDLFTRGLVSSHSGDLSVRQGEHLFITRRGSMLGGLGEDDLVETGLSRNNRATPRASTELALHRAIYRRTPARAIVHAQPPHAIALSLSGNEIAPCDHDGFSLLPRIPVLGWGKEEPLEQMADELIKCLKEYRIALVYGHGSFAVGQLLEEAYQLTTAVERSCQIICLLRSLEANNPPLVR